MYFARTVPLVGFVCAAALALLPAAQGQSLTLTNNDNLTVTGVGTVGTLGGTTYLPGQNAASSYNVTGGASFAVQTSLMSAFTLGTGGTLAGGYQGGGLNAAGYGSVTVSGGSLTGGQYGYGLKAGGSGTVSISGGELTGGDGGDGLFAWGNDVVSVSGGTLTAGPAGRGILAAGGTVNISGGTLLGGGMGTGINTGFSGSGLTAMGGAAVNISGGTLTAGEGGTGLLAFGYGPVTITGGNILGGKGGVGLKASNNVTINLFSQNDTPFLIDGVPLNNVSLTKAYHFSNVNGGLDTISGILLSGDILNTTFDSNNATINLNIGTPPAAVPETSSFVSLGALLMGLSLLAFRTCKKQTLPTG